MLIIIDTCFAGTGAIQLASEFQGMLFKYSRPEIYLLSAVLPNEYAEAGELASALIRSIEELSTRNVTQQYLSMEDVMGQINSRLRTQKAVFIPGMIMDRLHFFPNPSFVDTGGRAVFANEAQRAILDQEFRDHWGPMSRGVGFDAQPGNYFCGREAALQRIRVYLSGAGTRPLVVIGKAGAGKSAILSRIVRQSRERSSGVPPLDIVVHAKGKTLNDVVDRIAAASGSMPEPGKILDALAESGKNTLIVLDALDEATEPDAIAKALLRPMGTIGKVKLLIGSRENCLPLFGDVDVLNIDLQEYANDADITDYARQRLLRKDEPNLPTPYSGKEKLAEAAAVMIAKRANKNFLVARLIVEDLLRWPEPVDAVTSAEMALPATVPVIFDASLSHFAEKESMVRDLLLPLAYAEGKGFPWGNVWARAAADLSKRTYHDEDIRWLLSNAGAFILESVEDGQAVYRLYHLALQEALRSRHDYRSMQIGLTKALIAAVPRLSDGSTDWVLADPYIRRHLPAHAAAAGYLDELLLDPMFLVAAIPGGLLPVLRRAPIPASALDVGLATIPGGFLPVWQRTESRESLRSGRMYKMAAHLWAANASPGNWASYLEFTARMLGLDEVAERFGELSISRSWRIPWVSVAPSSAHRVLRGHERPVRAIVIRGDIVISADEGGIIRCWDVESGELIGEPLRAHEGVIFALSAGAFENREVIVSGGADSTIHLWSLQNGTEILPPIRGHKGSVCAVLLVELGGETVIISGGYDGTIRFWNAATGEMMRRPIQAHEEKIKAVALCNVEGVPVSISTGGNGVIRAWNALNGKLIAEGRTTDVVNALACLELNGRTIVASASNDGRIETWDPRTMTPISAAIKTGVSSLLCLVSSNLHGRPVLIADDGGGELTIWDPETGKLVGRPIWEQDTAVFALASDPLCSFIASGGYDGTIRLWDLEEAQRGPFRLSAPAFGTDSYVCTVAACDSIVAARSSDGRIGAFDLSVGEFLSEISAGANSGEGAIALAGGVNGPTLAFDMSGEIFTRDLAKPSAKEFHLGSLGGKADALLFHRLNGADVLTAVTNSDHVKSWDLIKKKETCNVKIKLLNDLPTEARIDVVALGTLGDGRPLIVSAVSVPDLLRIWRADTGELIREISISRGEKIWNYVEALAIAEICGRQWAACGDSEGTLTVWDTKHLAPIASLPGKTSLVTLDIKIASIAGSPAVVSGGSDHMLRAWWPETDRRESIDVGIPVNAIAVAPEETVIAGTARGLIAIRFGPHSGS